MDIPAAFNRVARFTAIRMVETEEYYSLFDVIVVANAISNPLEDQSLWSESTRQLYIHYTASLSRLSTFDSERQAVLH